MALGEANAVFRHAQRLDVNGLALQLKTRKRGKLNELARLKSAKSSLKRHAGHSGVNRESSTPCSLAF